ncbi:phosphoglycerate kinase [uncultured Lentibacter sp.]|uniref:phosphoglycerate kinase n=1 Tax=uncultured Lentibacter sp. TaxID=1659309 RepID=UPI002624C27E|nr:phosphoglycerate kinase [uncultured Lentibacter sp.]
MAWLTLDDLDLSGKRVLTRVDINVPLQNGRVSDASRITRIKPTVDSILAKGGQPLLLAHFGRPKGKVVLDMSLRVVLPALEAALGRKVAFVETLDAAETLPEEARSAEVILVENIRFHPGEEANDPAFAARLAALGDVYCNDAFSAAHRAHASTEGVARHLPSCAGRLMQAELTALESALARPTRPVGAVVGGAKVSTKLDLLSNLVEKLDVLIIGGGMANTFLMAQGADLGASLVEADMLDTARDIIAKAKAKGCNLILPSDGAVARAFQEGAPFETLPLTADTVLESDQMVLDAGPDSTAAILTALEGLKTLIWNGPLGAFEIAPFDTATGSAARKAAELTRAGQLITVAGGGDTVAALNAAEAAEDFSYISTAGGAFLEWMEGKTLPGVAALGG